MNNLKQADSFTLVPAIDLKDGACVRLKQGDMQQSTVFSNQPEQMAQHWLEKGCKRLHLVDLNGAFAGEPKNQTAIAAIIKTVKAFAAQQGRAIPIQLGGGIRDMATVERYLAMGIDDVIIGSAIVKDPDFVMLLLKEFGEHVIAGIDAKAGFVAIDGWADITQISAVELAKPFVDAGLSRIIFTDIARDGMLSGVNTESTLALAKSLNIGVFASGGLSSHQDVEALYALHRQHSNSILGAICGRAIYEGQLDFATAQLWVNRQEN